MQVVILHCNQSTRANKQSIPQPVCLHANKWCVGMQWEERRIQNETFTKFLARRKNKAVVPSARITIASAHTCSASHLTNLNNTTNKIVCAYLFCLYLVLILPFPALSFCALGARYNHACYANTSHVTVGAALVRLIFKLALHFFPFLNWVGEKKKSQVTKHIIILRACLTSRPRLCTRRATWLSEPNWSRRTLARGRRRGLTLRAVARCARIRCPSPRWVIGEMSACRFGLAERERERERERESK